MRRVRNTLKLAKESWAVLNQDKELLVLPVLSFIATLIVIATFLVPLFTSGAFADTTTDPSGEESLSTLTYVVMFVMYVVLAFVTIFFNAALVSAANDRMNGQDPTLKTAVAGASLHLGSIFGWAVVTATVSIILRAIEERAGFVGRIVTGFAGAAWSLVTFLVIPVMVIEGIGVVDGVKRAGTLFKQTWGEQVAANVGFGLLGFVAAIPGIGLIVGAAALGGGFLAAGIVIGVLWLGTVAVVMSALNGIFQTALYRYAAAGSRPVAGFDAEMLAHSFGKSRRRR